LANHSQQRLALPGPAALVVDAAEVVAAVEEAVAEVVVAAAAKEVGEMGMGGIAIT
jgi:hypothetical protein